MQTAAERANDPVTIGGQRCLRDHVHNALGHALDALPWHVSQPRRFPLGVHRGLRFGLALHPQFPPEVYLEGAATRLDTLSRDHHGPRAVLNALERLAGNYRAVSASVQQELTIAESQLRDYQARIGQPFTHDAYLAQLTELRDQLKAGLASPKPAGKGGLSAQQAEEGSETLPVAELAERIKALKAAHTIEATPERTAARGISAEEPVTARIRRRAEAGHAESAAEAALAPAADEEFMRPEGSFQDRVAESRRDRKPAV